ncbi:Cof-type HAD-IIB family hydrolase [Sphingomonas sp. PR090111-T3T-6A]|uniref:Cof-type HAD-IIB family hydrolase n=1 Tax=Sphingomonas sp. PR090111-T3T-6A TaxID=685778 RepID=UPI000360DFA0|nr:Cof-type HAD-IIB family hydrolase [Sphingomonas sp. PR090111-T3T-6A]
MKHPIRLFVSDVDGTLVRRDKSLSDATIEAAHRLAHAQVAMTLISARPPSGILPLARALGLTNTLAAFNGGTLVSPEGEILVARHIDADASRTAVALIRASGASLWAFADGQWYISDGENPHLAREERSSMVAPIVRDDFESLHGRIDKLVGVSDDEPLVAKLEADCKAALGGSAEVSCSQTYYCDITHPKANKGDGIAALSAALDIPLEETAAIGDMPNDIPMLRQAGMAIAMGQAPATVKAEADWISATNDEDGVAKAIERVLLPEVARHRL